MSRQTDIQAVIDHLKASSSPWGNDPSFSPGGGGSINGGPTPWWAPHQPPPGSPGSGTAPPPQFNMMGGDSTDPSMRGKPTDGGGDASFYGNGGNYAGGYEPPSTSLSPGQAAGVLGFFTGIPSQVTSPLLASYGNAHGQNPFPAFQPGVSVSDPSTGAHSPSAAQYHAGEMQYGDNTLNGFLGDSSNYWNTVNPNQGIGHAGNGGLFGQLGSNGSFSSGGARTIYDGSASPWDWGDFSY